MKQNNKILTGFILFIGLYFTLSNGVAQTRNNPISEKEKTIRLLVIGNSFSKNATLYLPQLANEGGFNLIIGKAEISGGPLKMHWDAVEAFEKNNDDPKGKLYRGKSLKALLSEHEWDIVTMQQGSVFSADPETYTPYIKNLYDYIKKLQPRAEIVIHQTWAYRNDAKSFSRIKGEERAKDQKEMWEKSREAYHKVADLLGLRIIPNGDAFWKVSSDPKWAYKKDHNFNFSKPVYPELPDQKNSLNIGYTWTKNKTLKLDPNHANDAGCYLGALTWYGFLFGKSPVNLKFVPEGVSPEFAEYLKKVAWENLLKKDDVKVYRNIRYGDQPNGIGQDTTSDRTLDLYLPSAKKEKLPVFVFIHGGGFSGGDKASTKAFCSKISSYGYAVVSINYYLTLKHEKVSGASCSGNMSKGLPVNGFHPKLQEAIRTASADAQLALKWIKNNADKYNLNQHSVAISGGSAGAMTALYTAYVSKQKELPIKAVVNLWGGLENSNLIKKGSAPLLTYHGDQDKLINVDYAYELERKMKENGSLNSITHICEGKGHAIYGFITKEKTEEIAAFLKKNL